MVVPQYKVVDLVTVLTHGFSHTSGWRTQSYLFRVTHCCFLLGLLILVLYFGSLFEFFIGVPYWCFPFLSSLFMFLIWIPYWGSLLRCPIRVPYSCSFFEFLIYNLFFLISSFEFGSISVHMYFCSSCELYSSFWRLKVLCLRVIVV